MSGTLCCHRLQRNAMPIADNADWLIPPRMIRCRFMHRIAPEDRDVHDPAAGEGNVLVSAAERQQLKNLLQLGLSDSFRLFEQPAKPYTWWDYRKMAFRRNMGMRIDHILISEPLVAHCKSCVIDKAPRKLERPSDHTPVVVEL